ncbi:MAG TPA: vWA domain-containing protein [Thiohalobacter sp.]|nr:vWA domain-containing protein [Thiohalobacter sp.]
MERSLSGHPVATPSPFCCRAGALLLAAGLWLLTVTAPAADSDFVAAGSTAGVDAVLIIDSSGSMKETDPRRMRVPAARMFISLLGGDDRVGVISFSDNGYPVAHLTPATEANHRQLFAAVDKVSALGAYTNLYAALETGRRMLDEADGEDRRHLLLLLSDGRMDTGDYDQDRALTRAIEQEMIGELRAAGIEVYTLAFTEASDMPLLRTIATGTGGISRLASNDRELHRAFSTLFESAKKPDMLPIEGGEFLVDDTIEEVTVVASKHTPGSEIKLIMPDARVIRPEVAGPAVRWHESDGFDMITIDQPPAGTWRLVSDGADNRAYVVTDMRLEGRFDGPEPIIGEQVQARAWLEQDGEPITATEILDHTAFRMEIIPPEGAVRHLSLAADAAADPGRFLQGFEFTRPGSHRIRLIASGQTFKREKSLFVEVPPLPEGATPPAPEPGGDAAAGSPPEPQAPPQPEPAAEAEAEPEPEAEIPPAMQEEIIDPAPEAEERAQTQTGPGLGLILGLFVLANVVIGAAIGGFLWWRRRRRRKAAGRSRADTGDETDEQDTGPAKD